MSVVTLEEARTFIRLSPKVSSVVDTHVQQCLTQAEAWIEKETCSSFTNKLHRETFPGNLIYLGPNFGPVTEVVSVYDSTQQRTLEEDEYEFETDYDRIFKKTTYGNRTRWPRGCDRFTVSYYGGYTGDDGDAPFPEGLKFPVLMLARHLYVEGNLVGFLNHDFYDILRNYKLRGI